MNPGNPHEQITVQNKNIREVGSVTLKPHNKNLKKLLRDGKYDAVSESVIPDRFTKEVIGPLDEETKLVFVKLDNQTTTEEMLSWAAENNLGRPYPGDILRFGIQYPIQRQTVYVGLHEPVLIPGGRSVLLLWDLQGKRGLNLCWFDQGEFTDCVFVFRSGTKVAHEAKQNKVIMRRVRVDRTRTPQQMLAAMECAQYLNPEAVETMPHGGAEEVELHFVEVQPWTNAMELASKFEEHGLTPDPYAMMQANIDDPDLAREYPNATMWDMRDGEASFIATSFDGSGTQKVVFVARDSGGPDKPWWICGIPKQP